MPPPPVPPSVTICFPSLLPARSYPLARVTRCGSEMCVCAQGVLYRAGLLIPRALAFLSFCAAPITLGVSPRTPLSSKLGSKLCRHNPSGLGSQKTRRERSEQTWFGGTGVRTRPRDRVSRAAAKGLPADTQVQDPSGEIPGGEQGPRTGHSGACGSLGSSGSS